MKALDHAVNILKLTGILLGVAIATSGVFVCYKHFWLGVPWVIGGIAFARLLAVTAWRTPPVT